MADIDLQSAQRMLQELQSAQHTIKAVGGVVVVLVSAIIGLGARAFKKTEAKVDCMDEEARQFMSREEINQTFATITSLNEARITMATLISKAEFIAHMDHLQKEGDRKHRENQDVWHGIQASMEAREKYQQEFGRELSNTIHKVDIKVTRIATRQESRNQRDGSESPN